jgi:hypothetical protein
MGPGPAFLASSSMRFLLCPLPVKVLLKSFKPGLHTKDSVSRKKPGNGCSGIPTIHVQHVHREPLYNLNSQSFHRNLSFLLKYS